MQCTHLDQIREVKPSAKGCEDCLKIGGSGCICGCAWSAGMWGAALFSESSMRRSIFIDEAPDYAVD